MKQILNIDCREGMNNLPPDSVDIIFTDPPYVAEEYVQAYTALAEGGGEF